MHGVGLGHSAKLRIDFAEWVRVTMGEGGSFISEQDFLWSGKREGDEGSLKWSLTTFFIFLSAPAGAGIVSADFG